jgi:hypothetical protein
VPGQALSQPSPDYGGENQQHVADVLPFVLPAKSLTINTVTDVADFPDLHINIAVLFRWLNFSF